MAILVFRRVIVGLTCWHAKAPTEEAGCVNDSGNFQTSKNQQRSLVYEADGPVILRRRLPGFAVAVELVDPV